MNDSILILLVILIGRLRTEGAALGLNQHLAKQNILCLQHAGVDPVIGLPSSLVA